LQALDEIEWNQTCATYLSSVMKLQKSSTMKHFIPHLAMTTALLSFAFGQSASQHDSQDSKSEQEVRQMIEKYRSALLQRDIPALERIWADDYVFVNAAGDVLTKAQRLANAKSSATTLDSIKEEENITVRVYQNSAVATSRVTIRNDTAVNRPAANIGVHTFG
jgi:ketosteroid isomerase-like protein